MDFPPDCEMLYAIARKIIPYKEKYVN